MGGRWLQAIHKKQTKVVVIKLSLSTQSSIDEVNVRPHASTHTIHNCANVCRDWIPPYRNKQLENKYTNLHDNDCI